MRVKAFPFEMMKTRKKKKITELNCLALYFHTVMKKVKMESNKTVSFKPVNLYDCLCLLMTLSANLIRKAPFPIKAE